MVLRPLSTHLSPLSGPGTGCRGNSRESIPSESLVVTTCHYTWGGVVKSPVLPWQQSSWRGDGGSPVLRGPALGKAYGEVGGSSLVM